MQFPNTTVKTVRRPTQPMISDHKRAGCSLGAEAALTPVQRYSSDWMMVDSPSQLSLWFPGANGPGQTCHDHTAPLTLAPSWMRKRGIKLGRDHFAVRALTWKAPAFIDYTAQLKTDSLLITDLDAFEKWDDDGLTTTAASLR